MVFILGWWAGVDNASLLRELKEAGYTEPLFETGLSPETLLIAWSILMG
jgi:hypothetical protein